jgi:hypothetical protein
MTNRLAPILVLMLLAAILPETLSGNTPAHELFKPGPFVFFMIAYGLPALLIREFSVRHAIGFSGLFLIGMGYGIINEALLAKTVFRNAGVPVDVYDGYGFANGIQWAWTAFILPWHAMASTILPIAFAHRAVPAAASQPWLGVKSRWALALVLFALITLFYIYEDTSGVPGTWPMLAVLWGAVAALVLAARRLPAGPPPAPGSTARWKRFLIGYSGIIPFLSLIVIAHSRWPLGVYFAAVIFWMALYRFLTRRFAHVNHKSSGWFGLGWYLQIGTFSWIGVAPNFPYMVAVDLAVFAVLIYVVKRSEGTPG